MLDAIFFLLQINKPKIGNEGFNNDFLCLSWILHHKLLCNGQQGKWPLPMDAAYGDLSETFGLFQTRIGFKIGNGMKISFGNDIWIGENTLKDLFSELYSLC